MGFLRLFILASSSYLAESFSCPPCYVATRTVMTPCPTTAPECTGPASPRTACTVTTHVWNTTLVDNVFCETQTVTSPACPPTAAAAAATTPACAELLDPSAGRYDGDLAHCQLRTVVHNDPPDYDFCATTGGGGASACADDDDDDVPLPTVTSARCRVFKCQVPTRECTGGESPPVVTTTTGVIGSVTEDCTVTVFAGLDPCPVCPRCTPASDEEVDPAD